MNLAAWIFLGTTVIALIYAAVQRQKVVEIQQRYEGRPPAPIVPSTPYEPSSEVLRLVAAGLKIKAIKQVRDETNWGLKEAKDYVESIGG